MYSIWNYAYPNHCPSYFNVYQCFVLQLSTNLMVYYHLRIKTCLEKDSYHLQIWEGQGLGPWEEGGFSACNTQLSIKHKYCTTILRIKIYNTSKKGFSSILSVQEKCVYKFCIQPSFRCGVIFITDQNLSTKITLNMTQPCSKYIEWTQEMHRMMPRSEVKAVYSIS